MVLDGPIRMYFHYSRDYSILIYRDKCNATYAVANMIRGSTHLTLSLTVFEKLGSSPYLALETQKPVGSRHFRIIKSYMCEA